MLWGRRIADIEELHDCYGRRFESDHFVHDEIGTNQCFDWG
jgi:hypothetical protein